MPASAELIERAWLLALEYLEGQVRPVEVRWEVLEPGIEGQCWPDGVIDVAWQFRAAPDYVIDFILIHEMAHMIEWEHGPVHDALVARYRKSKLAQAWLDAEKRAAAICEGRALPTEGDCDHDDAVGART